MADPSGPSGKSGGSFFGKVFSAVKSGLGSLFGFQKKPKNAPSAPQVTPQPPPTKPSIADLEESEIRDALGLPAQSDVTAFLAGKEITGFQSSNVEAFQYDFKEHGLEIGYKNGGRYGYHDVSPALAKTLYETRSKGGWVWDKLRLRGTVFGFQKPYAFLAGKSKGYAPKYYWNQKWRDQHRQIGPEGQVPIDWLTGGPYQGRTFSAGQSPWGPSPEEMETRPGQKTANVLLQEAFGMSEGGTVQQRFGLGGDDEPAFLTAGERVIPKDIAQRNKAFFDWLLGAGGPFQNAHHYAEGGVVGAMAGAAGGFFEKYASATIMGMLGKLGGPIIGGAAGAMLPNILGGLFGKGGGGATGEKGKSATESLLEAATQLKEAAKMLATASGQAIPAGSPLSNWQWTTGKGGIPTLSNGMPQPIFQGGAAGVNVPTGGGFGRMPGQIGNAGQFTSGLGVTPTGVVSKQLLPAGGMGGAVAGPIIAGAMLAKQASDKLFEGFHKIVDLVPQVAEGLSEMAGMPRSVSDLFGKTIDMLVMPVHVVGEALHYLVSPLELIQNPLKLLKVSLSTIVDAGTALAKAFWDLRDPAGMLNQAIAPFTAQVGKYMPASVERLNLAFDNLSAAAGYIFEPIINAARDFADELNVIYTAIGPEFRTLIGQIIPPIQTFGREVAVGLIGGARELMPIFRRLMTELSPLGGIIREVIPAFAGAMGGLFEAIRPIFGEVRTALEGLAASFIWAAEWIRDNAETIQLAGQVGLEATGLPGAFRFGQWFGGLFGNGGEGGGGGGGGGNGRRSFQEILDAIRTPTAVPQGNMTYAAQPARHIGIEEVGMEARRAAFSQGVRRPEEETADNTAQANQLLREMMLQLQQLGLLPGGAAPAPQMQQPN